MELKYYYAILMSFLQYYLCLFDGKFSYLLLPNHHLLSRSIIPFVSSLKLIIFANIVYKVTYWIEFEWYCTKNSKSDYFEVWILEFILKY